MANVLETSSYLELNLCETGREVCIADKRIHFTPKDYAVIHYVYSGAGTFVFRGVSYALKAGDCFFIPAGLDAEYSPAPHNPWSYFWIGVGGSKANLLLEAAGLSLQNPVLSDKRHTYKSHFEAIYDGFFSRGEFGLGGLGHLYLLFHEMCQDNITNAGRILTEHGHIHAAKLFIRNNFQFPITIIDVADSVGVSPNYLANLFAKEGEKSPKRYLIEVRMETAADLLRNTTASITDIAKAVGYLSPLHFSKSFRAYYGASPAHYRAQQGVQ